MAIHRPFTRPFITLDGNVRTSGGSKNLAKGQFTIVNKDSVTTNGAEVVSNFNALPKDANLELRLGVHNAPESRTSNIPVRYSSEIFKLKDIVDFKVSAPKFFKRTFDDYILGYDGINADSAIALQEGQTTLLSVTVKGDYVGFVNNGVCDYTFTVHFGKEPGETDQEVVERAVETLKKQIFPSGVSLETVIDVKAVNSENNPLAGVTSYVFSTLTVTDEGDTNALARVQAQYPLFPVQRTDRDSLKSEYTILHPSTTSLSNFTQTVAKEFKSCENCPAGYDAVTLDGVIYRVTIEDDGADLSTTVDNLPGAVSGSVVKVGQNEGVGTYTVVLDNELTSAEIATYVGTVGAQSTAQITLLGSVADVCYDDTVTSTAWVAKNTCKASVRQYKIQLADGDCDGVTLAKLQANYPDLTIVQGAYTGVARQTVTISGSSGDAVIAVNGTNYTTAYTSNPTATATAFVTAHAATILAETGLTVTSSGAVITFQGSAVAFPVIAGVAGGLTETVSAITYVTTATTGACQGVYSTNVVTNIVCDECDPVFVQKFKAEAPNSFDFKEWELVPLAPNQDALMGIRFTAKPFDMLPTEATIDQVPFFETSSTIKVSGGHIEDVISSFDPQFSNPFKVTRLSRKQDRDGLGYHLRQWEESSRMYFTGLQRHTNNLFAKAIFGEESVLKFDKQYVVYHVYIHDTKYSQGAGRSSDMATEYAIIAEFGRHEDIENYLNKLAVAAGHLPVQVSAN